MNGVPTTTVTILRGQGTDVYEDVEDVPIVVASGILASLHETQVSATSDASSMQRQVGTYSLRMKNGIDVRIEDRVTDERTALTYVVMSVTTPPSTGRLVDVHCVLRRVAGQ